MKIKSLASCRYVQMCALITKCTKEVLVRKLPIRILNYLIDGSNILNFQSVYLLESLSVGCLRRNEGGLDLSLDFPFQISLIDQMNFIRLIRGGEWKKEISQLQELQPIKGKLEKKSKLLLILYNHKKAKETGWETYL